VRVMRLSIKHIKGVRSVEIVAHPVINEIAGKNGSGKSSVLDSIPWAIGGKRNIIGKALRDGSAKGEIVVETEDLTVRRVFSESGDTKLVAASKDGKKIGQRELDGLFSTFSFDPLLFSGMPPAEQLGVLQQLAGTEFCAAFAALGTQIEEAAAERTLANRELSRVGAIPEVAETQRVDVGELLTDLRKAQTWNREQIARGANIQNSASLIASLERQIADLQSTVEEHKTRAATLLKPEPTIPEDGLQQKLTEAGAQNQRADAYAEYQRRVTEKAERARVANAAEAKLSELRDRREALSGQATLPLPGVEFGEQGLRVNGRPWENLSSSEALRISARIGMLLAPELRVMFIKDGSLLDDDSFAEFRRLLEETGFQGWIETVGRGHGDAIIMEAGEVVESPLAASAETF